MFIIIIDFFVENSIGVKAFIELTESDISGSALDFTLGGKLIIRKVLDKFKVH